MAKHSETGWVLEPKWQHRVHPHYFRRRHGNFEKGELQECDSLVLHWTASPKDIATLGDYLDREGSDESYHVGIGRAGLAHQFVSCHDTAFHAGDGRLPRLAELVELERCGGTLPVQAAARRRSYEANLRTIGVAFCNRGFLTPESAMAARARGTPIYSGRHENPASRRTDWEAYTRAQIVTFEALIPLFKRECPHLRYVLAHSDVTNAPALGQQTGSKTDTGPAFPWATFPWAKYQLQPVRFDYKLRAWTMPNTGAAE